MTWLTVMEYMCQKWTRICSNGRKHFLVLSSFTTYYRVTRLTRRVPLVAQELLISPKHMSSPPVYSGVRVTRSLIIYVYFVDHCLSFCACSFGHCVVCSSSIYGFWLPLWYLQTLLKFQWDDDEVLFVLDQHVELHFYSASSLKQHSAGTHVAPLGHIILIPSQAVFALSP
jgi:hypothetical protein